MNFCGKGRQLTDVRKMAGNAYGGGDNMIDDRKIRDILKAVPGSYDDFVYSTAECMNRDEKLKGMILDLLREKPESNSSDVLKELCNFYGYNKPVELVDDDEDYEGTDVGVMREAGMISA